MTRLRIYADDAPQELLFESERCSDIARTLAGVGVRMEQWQTRTNLEPGASHEAVIAAYRPEIDRLTQSGGYQAVDVVSLNPQHPDRAVLRQKFLNEHTHAEDEVRFFVAGRGLFTLHIGERIFEVLCVQGDLISVPAGTRHWFDMSEAPSFIAIRLFTNPAGWVANFTGSEIAAGFPRLAAA